MYYISVCESPKEDHRLENVVSLRFKTAGKPRRCWEGGVKTGFIGAKLESMDWVCPAQNRSGWHAFGTVAVRKEGCVRSVEFVE